MVGVPATEVPSGVAEGAATVVVAAEVGLATAAGEVVAAAVAALVGVRVRVGAEVGVAVGAGAAQLTMRDKVSRNAATTRSRFRVILCLLFLSSGVGLLGPVYGSAPGVWAAPTVALGWAHRHASASDGLAPGPAGRTAREDTSNSRAYRKRAWTGEKGCPYPSPVRRCDAVLGYAPGSTESPRAGLGKRRPLRRRTSSTCATGRASRVCPSRPVMVSARKSELMAASSTASTTA